MAAAAVAVFVDSAEAGSVSAVDAGVFVGEIATAGALGIELETLLRTTAAPGTNSLASGDTRCRRGSRAARGMSVVVEVMRWFVDNWSWGGGC